MCAASISIATTFSTPRGATMSACCFDGTTNASVAGLTERSYCSRMPSRSRPAAGHVALDATREPHVRIRVDKDLEVEEVAHRLVVQRARMPSKMTISGLQMCVSCSGESRECVTKSYVGIATLEAPSRSCVITPSCLRPVKGVRVIEIVVGAVGLLALGSGGSPSRSNPA